jgi:hypothetical protein
LRRRQERLHRGVLLLGRVRRDARRRQLERLHPPGRERGARQLEVA